LLRGLGAMPNSLLADKDILRLRDELLDLAAQISEKYSSRKSEKFIIDLLMEHSCERLIIESLALNLIWEDDIDRLWRGLHIYAVSLLIERLKNRLIEEGFDVSLVNEAECPTGRYDILLIINNRGIKILTDGNDICLEVKTGFGVSFEQIEKYMWNGTIVILVRCVTGHALAFRAQDWSGPLRTVLEDRIKKAKRILDGNVVLVRGPDCKKCPLKDCKFNEFKAEENETERANDFYETLDKFRKNATKAIETAVNLVLQELRRTSTQIYKVKEGSPTEN